MIHYLLQINLIEIIIFKCSGLGDWQGMTLHFLRQGGFKINFVFNKIVGVINFAIITMINLFTKIQCSKTCCVKNGLGNCDLNFLSIFM